MAGTDAWNGALATAWWSAARSRLSRLEPDVEALERGPILGAIELFSSEREMDPQRGQALSSMSRPIRRRSARPTSMIRARDVCSTPSSAPFSTAGTVAVAAARTTSASSASVSSISFSAIG